MQLFKETHTVFFMGTVVRRCSVEATQLERGRQFCFFAKCCQKPDKTAQAGEKLSVKGGWRERRGDEDWVPERKAKACKERFCYQIQSEGNRWRVRAARERERQNEIEINTYLQQRVFSSSRRDLVWNINGDRDGTVRNKKHKRGRVEEKGRIDSAQEEPQTD